MALHVLIGAAVGAVLGAGTSIVTSLVRKKPIDWKSVGAAALGGAAAGAITSLTFGAGALAGTAVARVGGMTLAGASGGFTEQASDNVFHGRQFTEDLARSTAEGAAIGAAAGVVRVAARPVASLLSRNPALKREVAKRAAREVMKPIRKGLERYKEALIHAPRRTQAATSFTITTAGDLIAQGTDDKPGIDWKRTAYRGIYSALWSGTLGWSWMKQLERWFPGGTWRALLSKVGLDQVVMAPVSSVPFYAGYGLLVEGDSLGEAGSRGVHTTVDATKMAWPAWPAFAVANFKLFRPEMRSVTGNLAGLVWSIMSSKMLDSDAGQARKPVVDRPLGEDDGSRDGLASARGERERRPIDRATDRLLDRGEEAVAAASEGLIDAIGR